MITQEQDIAYLLSPPINHTGTNLADHLDGGSHDVVSDFLRTTRITARNLGQLVQGCLTDSPDACLIVDDSVQDKRYSHFIELVKRQYSGAVGGLVRGIGIVNLVHTTGPNGEFSPIDSRISAPEQDGKTKNDHFREMLIRAASAKGIQAKTVLFDSGYASVDNRKLVQRLGHDTQSQPDGKRVPQDGIYPSRDPRVGYRADAARDQCEAQGGAVSRARIQGGGPKRPH